VRGRKEKTMPHPVVHAEIRSQDPDATRKFYADLFGWAVASEGAFPGYTFIDTGVEGGTHVAISPRQADHDEVLFFVAVDDVAATLSRVEKLGASEAVEAGVRGPSQRYRRVGVSSFVAARTCIGSSKRRRLSDSSLEDD
jgi:hypothetical protein